MSMGSSPTSSTIACSPLSTKSLYESMCWCTRPLSRMNSLARNQSLGCANAILFSPIILFSKFFYYVPIEVGFACRLTFPDDLNDVARLGTDGSGCGVAGFDVGELVRFYVVLFEYLFGLFGFQENVLGNEVMLEQVIRRFLLFFLLFYQVLYCYLGGTGSGL